MPQVQTTVAGTALQNAAAGTNPTLAAGRSAEALIAELHGKYYSAAYGGKLFFVTTATAGTTIPVQAGSLVSTFTLYNPPGSGVNLELIEYSAAFQAATMVVSDVSLYYQAPLVAQFLAVTALTTRSAGILGGSSAPQAATYSAASFVGAMTIGPTLFGPTTTQSVAGGSTGPALFAYQFDGKIIVPPGAAVTTAGNAAQSQATKQTMFWAEWPI